MTGRALVKEADIARALRAAKKLGAYRVKVSPDGSIDIVLVRDDKEALPDWQPDGPLVHIRKRPTKKVTL